MRLDYPEWELFGSSAQAITPSRRSTEMRGATTGVLRQPL